MSQEFVLEQREYELMQQDQGEGYKANIVCSAYHCSYWGYPMYPLHQKHVCGDQPNLD